MLVLLVAQLPAVPVTGIGLGPEPFTCIPDRGGFRLGFTAEFAAAWCRRPGVGWVRGGGL